MYTIPGAREAEDDAGAVLEEETDALTGRHAAVNRVLVLELIRSGKREGLQAERKKWENRVRKGSKEHAFR